MGSLWEAGPLEKSIVAWFGIGAPKLKHGSYLQPLIRKAYDYIYTPEI